MSDTEIGFSGLLTIVFITLKLTGYITWSWWWVLSPIWIPTGIGILIVMLLIIIAALGKIIKYFVGLVWCVCCSEG